MTAIAATSISALPKPRLPQGPINLSGLVPQRRDGIVHKAILAMVWLAVASGCFVFSEPAPVDLLNMGLIVLLPVVGLVAVKPEITAMLALWLIVAAGGYVASAMANDLATATIQTSVSLYLYIAGFVLAAFVARNPARHTKLILDAYLAGALVAATLGFSGYFDLPPGAAEIFTRYSRATGAFKDPNVLGAFLVPAMVYAFHRWLNRPLLAGLPLLAALGYLSIALLLTFSRGAWFAAVAAIAIYAYLTFVTARRDIDRVRLIAIGLVGTAALAVALIAASGIDQVSNLLSERASLTQSYDVGPEGRFGGQQKALQVLTEHPLGIGPLEFNVLYHHEDPHNSYLTMFLNTGWIGGFAFLIIVGLTLVIGLRHALKRTRNQALFIVAYAALAALLLESAIIDSDHWRHLHLMFAVVWGLIASDKFLVRQPRIVADCRNVLLQPVIVLAPSRRGARIVRVLPRRPVEIEEKRWNRPPRIILNGYANGHKPPSRAPRIVVVPPRVLN